MEQKEEILTIDTKQKIIVIVSLEDNGNIKGDFHTNVMCSINTIGKMFGVLSNIVNSRTRDFLFENVQENEPEYLHDVCKGFLEANKEADGSINGSSVFVKIDEKERKKI